jgi:hypothetical protein
VVSSQDRLGPVALTHELKARLLAAGAVLLVPDNPAAEVLDAKGFAALPADLVAQIHTAQREEIGLRWHKARRAAVEYGIHPSTFVPVGYSRNEVKPKVSGKAERAKLAPEQRWADPARRQLVPSEYAPAILALFKLRAAKGSWSECCKLLEDAGVPNAKGKATSGVTIGRRGLPSVAAGTRSSAFARFALDAVVVSRRQSPLLRSTFVPGPTAIPVPRFPSRSGRNLAGPALPQTPGDDLGRRLCAEPLELADSSSKSAIIVSVGKREGGFVGAADLRP